MKPQYVRGPYKHSSFIINVVLVKVTETHSSKTMLCLKIMLNVFLYPLTDSNLSLIYSLTPRVVGAPQMISQPVSSIFTCSPLPSGTWQTTGLSIPWCCLPTSSSVCLVFFPLSLCLARWYWPDLMNRRHDHTTAVCVSLWWSGDLHVVQLPARSCWFPECNLWSPTKIEPTLYGAEKLLSFK